MTDAAVFVSAWYRWGVAIGFAMGLASTCWIFFDSQRNHLGATLWRVLSLAAAMAIVPSALLSLTPVLAIGLGQLPATLAYLGLAGALLALATLVLYVAGIGVRESPSRGETPTFDPLPPPGAITRASLPAPTPLTHRPATSIPPTLATAAPAASLEDDRTRVLTPEPSLPEPLAWVVIMNGIRAGKEFRLSALVDIGRDASRTDITLDDPAISRQHARIRLEQEGFVIYDLASANGVAVNGEAVQRQPLHNGDRIVIGQTELGVMVVKESEGAGEIASQSPT